MLKEEAFKKEMVQKHKEFVERLKENKRIYKPNLSNAQIAPLPF